MQFVFWFLQFPFTILYCFGGIKLIGDSASILNSVKVRSLWRSSFHFMSFCIMFIEFSDSALISVWSWFSSYFFRFSISFFPLLRFLAKYCICVIYDSYVLVLGACLIGSSLECQFPFFVLFLLLFLFRSFALRQLFSRFSCSFCHINCYVFLSVDHVLVVNVIIFINGSFLAKCGKSHSLCSLVNSSQWSFGILRSTCLI